MDEGGKRTRDDGGGKPQAWRIEHEPKNGLRQGEARAHRQQHMGACGDQAQYAAVARTFVPLKQLAYRGSKKS